MLNKRGVSPLLATVLIVGITIAIAVSVFLFLKGQTELAAKKGDVKFSANEEAGVDFEVVNCVSGGIDGLDIKIHNTGSEEISCFWVAPESGDTKLSVFNMKPGKEDTLTVNSVSGNVDLYPCLIEKNKVKTGSTPVSAICSA